MSKPDDRCPPMLAPLLSKLIDSRLSAEDREKLQDLLLTDTNCLRYYARFMQVHAAMQWSMGQVRPEKDTELVEMVEDEQETDIDSFLSMLNSPVDETESIHTDSSSPLTRKAYTSALTYVIEHTFTPKRVAVLATAAALLLGLVLTVVLLSGGPDDALEVAEPPQQPTVVGPSEVQASRVVATLTDEHDAVWDRRPGGGLFAAQRLSLLKGFAEITTQRGAVALLEAPCTIELIHDNAVRLERGRLVGIVEGEQAQGFLVRTPQMDVVDLGTRFGVEVDDESNSTFTHVFEGSVRVSQHAGDEPALLVAAGEGVQSRGGQLRSVPRKNIGVFLQDMRMAHNMIQGSDTVYFLNEPPVSLMPGAMDSNEWVHVLPERTGLRVTNPIRASFSEPGQYNFENPAVVHTELSQRVDSYLIHFDPIGDELSAAEKISGEIKFPRPIVAVIGDSEMIQKSDRWYARQGTRLDRELTVSVGPDNNPSEVKAWGLETANDRLILSEDRMTLSFHLQAGLGVDQFRVLIASENAD